MVKNFRKKRNLQTICLHMALAFVLAALFFGLVFFGQERAWAAGQVSSVKAAEMPLAPVPINGKQAQSYTILMYHHLAPAWTCTQEGPYYGNNAIMSVDVFAAQMKALHDKGLQTLLMSELYDYLAQGLMPPAGSVVITFDDGYASNYALAYPILKQYGLKASIAVVVRSSETEIPLAEGASYPDVGLPHLTFDQMREMAQSGLIEFGSHSYDGHGNVTINAAGETGPALVNKIYFGEGVLESDWEYRERIKNELVLSRQVLEKELGVAVTYFAYPYGRYNNALRQALKDAGYHIAVTTQAAQAVAGDSLLLLPRINASNDMSIEQYMHIIQNQ